MENNPKFYFFSQLPTELRYAIWRECLPNRVVEIDYPWDEGAYLCLNPPPCKLMQTTDINRRPPVISHVCRESRRVAFETGYLKTGYYRDKGSPPLEAQWESDLQLKKSWIDPSRDIIHLNWTPCYSAGYWGNGSALDFLAWSAVNAYGDSFMFDYLDNMLDEDIEERIKALQKLQHGCIVMHIIVVHTTFEIAAKTGLFGILGDAYIQLVDISDEVRLNAFFDFAKKCESETNTFVTRRQDFRRESPESVKRSLNDKLAETFGAQAARQLPPLCPAIMFRFCPHWCNHIHGSSRRAGF
ncbi:uncharacterized protein N7482_007878 [Penicillium canariense]|uniref:2EXR domain-containing protein n=1 Tax=Penicillium canariense TaxID=189055 RepID=A0A9W9HXM6_9EURO|nr:uncharacterized protein N7482_007878 [Penicillium canariense]KAJ5160874.1 hypothetical protein N7482_007878 [Penicillium canariense]